MSKDSQPDNKKIRERKSKGQTTTAQDGQNARRTSKRQSSDRGDV